MKHLTYTLVALFTIAVTFVACKSDDDVEYSSDCYIKSMVLGNLSRTIHSTTSDGRDTVYNVTLTGSAFPMAIDHVAGTIKNATPLPIGTNISAVTSTVTSQGMVVYAHANDTTMWTQFNAKDTLDFSKPYIFRVIASDGDSYRDYNVSLSVRQDDADKFTWTSLATVKGLTSRKTVKILSLGTKPMIFSSTDDGIYIARANSSEAATSQAAANWSEARCEGLPANADARSAVAYNGEFWMTSTDGRLFRSTNGIIWNEAEKKGSPSTTLFAASATALYASAAADEGAVVVSSTDGIAWQQQPTEKAFAGKVIASTAYTQPNGNRRVLIATARDGSATLDTWSLLEGTKEGWTLFSDDELNTNLLTNAEPLNIVYYNKQLIAFTPDGILISEDNGINWKDESKINLPADDITPRSAVAQGEYLYILNNDQLWQGRLNSYSE